MIDSEEKRLILRNWPALPVVLSREDSVSRRLTEAVRCGRIGEHAIRQALFLLAESIDEDTLCEILDESGVVPEDLWDELCG